MKLTILLSIVLSSSGQIDRTKSNDVGKVDSRETRSPYARWAHGPSADPGFFPIGVWLQDPRNAARYKQAGINLYVALWRGPTEAQLAALKAAGMPVICHQNRTGLVHRDDSIIVGWMHGDEPDNAQEVRDPKTGGRRYGPPVDPARIVADYERLRAADPTRPVMLNLGQGVANDDWVGRGPGASLDDYPRYVRGADVVSFDVYPVAGLGRTNGSELLWYVPKGIDRLIKWTEARKPVWNCIECTHIDNPGAQATPAQVKAEVWMALIHGSRGLIYFVHQFQPRFNEHALLDDAVMLRAVTAINQQIHDLAPVLNGPTDLAGGEAQSSDPAAPIDLLVKRRPEATYAFAAGMRNKPARGSIKIGGLPPASWAHVIGEDRVLKVVDGQFGDDFAAYGVHLYRITASATGGSTDGLK